MKLQKGHHKKLRGISSKILRTRFFKKKLSLANNSITYGAADHVHAFALSLSKRE